MCCYPFQTLLSLSKLALLVSGSETGNGNREMEELNRELSIVKYQKNIPQSALEVSVAYINFEERLYYLYFSICKGCRNHRCCPSPTT